MLAEVNILQEIIYQSEDFAYEKREDNRPFFQALKMTIIFKRLPLQRHYGGPLIFQSEQDIL